MRPLSSKSGGRGAPRAGSGPQPAPSCTRRARKLAPSTHCPHAATSSAGGAAMTRRHRCSSSPASRWMGCAPTARSEGSWCQPPAALLSCGLQSFLARLTPLPLPLPPEGLPEGDEPGCAQKTRGKAAGAAHGELAAVLPPPLARLVRLPPPPSPDHPAYPLSQVVALPGADKECRLCHQVKPASEYFKSSVNVDGLYSYCKRCDGGGTVVGGAALCRLLLARHTATSAQPHPPTHTRARGVPLQLRHRRQHSFQEEAARRAESSQSCRARAG